MGVEYSKWKPGAPFAFKDSMITLNYGTFSGEWILRSSVVCTSRGVHCGTVCGEWSEW